MKYKINKKYFYTFVVQSAIFTMVTWLFIFNTDKIITPDFIILLKGPLTFDDPKLINYIKESYLLPPPISPHINSVNSYNGGSWHFYDDNLQKLFGKKKTPGFFIEAGAADGAFITNTLKLEVFNHWTGLLVEPEPMLSKLLIKRKRNAWISQACLSPKSYPYKATFGSYYNKEFTDLTVKYKATTSLINEQNILNENPSNFNTFFKVQCVPIGSLIFAVKKSIIDLIVLDVEGSEIEILQNFPWDRITVDVWAVEHKHPNRSKIALNQRFINWFESKGYYLYASQLPEDYIFVRNSSSLT